MKPKRKTKPRTKVAAPRGRARRGASTTDPDLTLELVVLAPGIPITVCQDLRKAHGVALDTSGGLDAVPGEIVTVRVTDVRKEDRLHVVVGSVEAVRLDVAALGLVPLRLEDAGEFDPAHHDWGAPPAPWERAIIDAGRRPSVELENVVPGEDPALGDGPIVAAVELFQRGDAAAADEALLHLLIDDLRCLDAHAHLGNFLFSSDEHNPAVARHLVELALRHYRVGVAIGDLSLGPAFRGALTWLHLENRPYLRCLHGVGLCAWRLGRTSEALAVFERMLWLNPNDNQGARFLLDDVRAGRTWFETGGSED